VKIGDLARAGGVSVETVRFYQRRGLLPEPPRAAGARRYTQADLERLHSIKAAQTAGFTLEKIAILKTMRAALKNLASDCAKGGEGPCPILEAFSIPPKNGQSGNRSRARRV
jgi:MerR family mercuric resistance operon transcriptional regulator